MSRSVMFLSSQIVLDSLHHSILCPFRRVLCTPAVGVGQLLLQFPSLILGCVCDVDGDILSKLLGDFLQAEAGGFGEEEVDHWW
jgi:hypothetical protein